MMVDYDSEDSYISKNDIKDIWNRNLVHPDINARYDRLKILYHIKKAKSECKRA